MPTLPIKRTFTNNSVDVLNAIRNAANTDYQDYVPIATADAEVIREIGRVIMNSPSLQNTFVNSLVNRIGLVIMTSRMYDNPLRMFKKGIIDLGEVIEEIFVNIAKPFQFDPAVAESNLYKRQMPDVRAAFHVMNYQIFYKDTISHDQLKQAFTSINGVTDLISKIIESMYTGAEYDEFLVTKYLLAKRILNGMVYPVEIPAVEAANMKSIVSTIKSTSNKFEFMDSKYNLAKVKTHSKKDRQYILLNADFDATMDVEVLASAFNMGKAQFMGKRVLVDSFGTLDNERLAELFAGEPNYVAITDAELAALNEIPAVIVDADFFMIYDNLQNMTEKYNSEGLYWNYWYHVWKTFSISPFANAALFVPATPDVTSVTVSPATASLSEGSSIQLEAAVVVVNFAPQTVVWSSSSDKATVTADGKVTLAADATGTITITATSTVDSTVKDTCVITVV